MQTGKLTAKILSNKLFCAILTNIGYLYLKHFSHLCTCLTQFTNTNQYAIKFSSWGILQIHINLSDVTKSNFIVQFFCCWPIQWCSKAFSARAEEHECEIWDSIWLIWKFNINYHHRIEVIISSQTSNISVRQQM